MATLHGSADYLPELGGFLSGGLVIILQRPEEVDGLLVLCERNPGTAENPFQAIEVKLTEAIKSEIGFDAWLARQSDGRPPQEPAPESGPAGNVSSDPRDDLLASLRLGRELWSKAVEADPQEAPRALRMAVAVRFDNQFEIRCESDVPWLVLDRGSVRARLLRGVWKAADFVVGLFLRRGIAPSLWSDRLQKTLRRRARERQSTPRELKPLEELSQKGDLEKRCGLIVFVHGLLSTDLGVFDGVIDQLSADPAFSSRVALAGFPHDTLVPIKYNAQELADRLTVTVDTESERPPRVAFVCHSRGGLVARAAAVKLHRQDPWKALLKGCVTFGTPHEGAQLAEAPDEMLGALVVIQTLRGTRSFANVWDMLHYLGRREPEGITDLRPRNGGGLFLYELKEDERALVPKADGNRLRTLEILAVGGRVPGGAGGDLQRVIDRALTSEDHDLVVELESTTSQLVGPGIRRHCDHFSYFTPTEVGHPYFADVKTFLGVALELDACPYGLPKALGIDDQDDTVSVGNVSLPKNPTMR